MFCTRCGKQIHDDSTFCCYCGNRIIIISAEAETSNSDTSNPSASNPNTSNPSASNPNTSNPSASNANTSDSKISLSNPKHDYSSLFLKFNTTNIVKYSPYIAVALIVLSTVWGLIPTSNFDKFNTPAAYNLNDEIAEYDTNDSRIADNDSPASSKKASNDAMDTNESNIIPGHYVLSNHGELAPYSDVYIEDLESIIDFNNKPKVGLLSNEEVSFLEHSFGESNVGSLSVTKFKNYGQIHDKPKGAILYAVDFTMVMRALGQDGIEITSHYSDGENDYALSVCDINAKKNLECELHLDIAENSYKFEIFKDSYNNIKLRKLFSESSVNSFFASDHVHKYFSTIENATFVEYDKDDILKHSFIISKANFINSVLEINNIQSSLNKQDKAQLNKLLEDIRRQCFPQNFSSLEYHDKIRAYECTTKKYNDIISSMPDSDDYANDDSNDIRPNEWAYFFTQGTPIYSILSKDSGLLLSFECGGKPWIYVRGNNNIEYNNFEIIFDKTNRYTFNFKKNNVINAPTEALHQFFLKLRWASRIEIFSQNKKLGEFIPVKSSLKNIESIFESCVH